MQVILSSVGIQRISKFNPPCTNIRPSALCLSFVLFPPHLWPTLRPESKGHIQSQLSYPTPGST